MSRYISQVWLSCTLLFWGFLLGACIQPAEPSPDFNSATQAKTESHERIIDSSEQLEPFVGYTPESLLYVGWSTAPVTVYEMFNANCPGCAHHHANTLAQLVEEFAVAGQVRFLFVDLPLSSDWGEEAHFAGYCIGQQQGAEAEWQFWLDFYGSHSRWFREGMDFTTVLAEEAGVDMAGYESCLISRAREAVYARQEIAENDLLPSRWATPVFRLENRRGELLRIQTGSLSLEGWKQELDRHLN